jgi:hypothetical protein
MGMKCRIFLTRAAKRGYLFPLFPTTCMEQQPLRPQVNSSPDTLGGMPPEQLAEAKKLSRLAKLARSTRGMIGAALLAVGGAAAVDQGNAATMIQGQVVENVVGNQPQRALSLWNFQVSGYRVANSDGAADDVAKWFAFELDESIPDYLVAYYLEFAPNPPATVVAPDQVGNNRRRYFLVVGDLPELQTLEYSIGINNGVQGMNLNHALVNAKVYAGFGELSGMPTSLDEAMAMSETVMVGKYPSHPLALSDAWVFSQVDSIPELTGDYDADGDVDGDDLLQWQRGVGSQVTPYSGADGDGDGSIGAGDLAAWKQGFGTVQSANVASHATPEPSSAYLAAAGVVTTGLFNRRRLRKALNKS